MESFVEWGLAHRGLRLVRIFFRLLFGDAALDHSPFNGVPKLQIPYPTPDSGIPPGLHAAGSNDFIPTRRCKKLGNYLALSVIVERQCITILSGQQKLNDERKNKGAHYEVF